MSRAASPERKGPATGRPSLFKSVTPVRTEKTAAKPTSDIDEAIGLPKNRAAVRGRQDRSDKRQVAGFFSPECAKQLRMLAAEQDTTVQELIRDGLNLMFQKRGKPPIA